MKTFLSEKLQLGADGRSYNPGYTDYGDRSDSCNRNSRAADLFDRIFGKKAGRADEPTETDDF